MNRVANERRHWKVGKESDAMATALAGGMLHPGMKALMDTLEAERADFDAKLAAVPIPEPMTFHPGLTEVCAKKGADLAAAWNALDTRPEAAQRLRGLIDRIILTPDQDTPNGHTIALQGELGAILSACDGGSVRATLGAAPIAASSSK